MRLQDMEKKTPYHAVKPGRITGAGISAGRNVLNGAVNRKAVVSVQTKRGKRPSDHLEGAPHGGCSQHRTRHVDAEKADGRFMAVALLVPDRKKSVKDASTASKAGESVRQKAPKDAVTKKRRQEAAEAQIRKAFQGAVKDKLGCGAAEKPLTITRGTLKEITGTAGREHCGSVTASIENAKAECCDNVTGIVEAARPKHCDIVMGSVADARQEAIKESVIDDLWKETDRHGTFYRPRKREPYRKADIEELEHKCGVRNIHAGYSASHTAVFNDRQRMDDIIAECDEKYIEGPAVCSVEERARQNKEKEGLTRDKEKGRGKGNKKKAQASKVKKVMIRAYMIKELTQEDGGGNAGQLVKNLLKHEALKLLRRIGKALLLLAGKILLFLLPVILLCAAVLVPFLMIYGLFMSPGTYFSSVFDQDKMAKENPRYLKNVVQEMYTDFYGQITLFKNANALNEVTYPYGSYNNVDEIVAVYLARVTNMPSYTDMKEADSGHPPYLFIDTETEGALLKEVFAQFNYTQMEAVKVTVIGADGKPHLVDAHKMTAYFLPIDKWREGHEGELSEREKTTLKELLAQAEKSRGDNLASFAGEAVPIEDLVVPEGVDEKILYMAGFIRAEAGNQSNKGKLAVAFVILNRAGGAGGDIKGVLTAPYQFSCYIPYHTVEQYLTGYAGMTDEERNADPCWRAAVAAYTGTADNPIGDRRYYCNPKYCSVGETAQWQKIYAHNAKEDIVIIEDHVFCRYCW